MKSLITAAFLGLATVSSAKVVHVDKKRVIQITGPIYSTYKPASKLIELANKNTKPVYILIDSNGGSVIEGIRFMRIMDRVKARGIKIKCVVTGHAMSMAVHLFGNCSERYVLDFSLLMWHPAYISGQFKIDEKTAEQVRLQLSHLTKLLEKRLKRVLNLPGDLYEKYHDAELIMTGHELNHLSPKAIKIIKDVR